MRMMKKVMTGMSLAVAALAIAGGVNAADADAKVTVSFNGPKQTMSATTDNKQVFVSYDAIKVNSKTKAETLNAKAKWDVYDGGSEDIDLSALKTTKDVYIAVKDEMDAIPTVYKIAAVTKKLSGKYKVSAEGKSYIEFTETVAKNKTVLDLSKEENASLEYRTANTGWTDYVEKEDLFKINKYEKQGATLYFRYKASNMTAGEAKDNNAGTTPEASAAPETVAAQADAPAEYKIADVSGNFASAEVKVKISKEAAAATATINYDLGTFTIKKAMEYRQLIKGDSGYDYDTNIYPVPTGEEAKTQKSAEWMPGDKDAKTTVVTIADITKDGIFEVRAAAAANKKVASKVGIYAYKGTKDLELTNINNDLTQTSVAIKNDANNVNVTIENKSESTTTYLVYAGEPAADTKPIATVKPGKKVTAKKVAVGVKLYVRSASDKKTQTFRSNAAQWSDVEAAATPAPAVTDDPSASTEPEASQAPAE